MARRRTDDVSFLIGFAMGFLGSIAGMAAAVSTSPRYARSAGLGVSVNLSIFSLLAVVEVLLPGSVLGGFGEASTEPYSTRTILLLVAFVAIVILASILVFRASVGSGDEDPWDYPELRRHLPTVAVVVSCCLVVGGGLYWWTRSPEPEVVVVVDEWADKRVRGASVMATPVDDEAITKVRCVTLEEESLQGHVRELAVEDERPIGDRSITGDPLGAFTFQALEPEGRGILEAWGFEPAHVVWSAGRCHGTLALERRPSGTFRVQVPPLRFDGPLEVTACGGTVSGPGQAVVIPVYDVDEDCTIEVAQIVNGVRLPAPSIQARGQIGQEIAVSTGAPALPILAPADPGWRLVADGDHLVVEGVYPQSEAGRAQIELGDRIVELRGQPWPADGATMVPMPLTATVLRANGERRTVHLPAR